jgi:hypothetical protein
MDTKAYASSVAKIFGPPWSNDPKVYAERHIDALITLLGSLTNPPTGSAAPSMRDAALEAYTNLPGPAGLAAGAALLAGAVALAAPAAGFIATPPPAPLVLTPLPGRPTAEEVSKAIASAVSLWLATGLAGPVVPGATVPWV